jgi:hypothetical protein
MKPIIIFSIISAFLSFEINCTQDFENALNSNSSTQNRQSMEYIDIEENDIQTDSYHQHNQEDAQSYNNLQENIEYEYEEPRNNLKPIPITYDYPNNYKFKPYNKYTSTLRNPYIRTRYQPYSYMPSHKVYSYSQKRPPPLMWNNHPRQQPVYANLYWRKIIYPHPPYSGQNVNENIMIGPNSLANPNTAESNLINRRYMSANPPKRYYRYRNYYRPAVRTGNRRNFKAGFYPIQGYTVRRPTTHPLKLKPNATHFSNPSHYKRKQKVRPMNQISFEFKPQWLQDNSTT